MLAWLLLRSKTNHNLECKIKNKVFITAFSKPYLLLQP